MLQLSLFTRDSSGKSLLLFCPDIYIWGKLCLKSCQHVILQGFTFFCRESACTVALSYMYENAKRYHVANLLSFTH